MRTCSGLCKSDALDADSDHAGYQYPGMSRKFISLEKHSARACNVSTVTLHGEEMAADSNERIAALMAKRAQLDARIQRLKSRESEAERKARSRALLLLGVATEKHLRKQPGFAQHVRQLVAQYLQEREQEAVLDFLFSSASASEAERKQEGPASA